MKLLLNTIILLAPLSAYSAYSADSVIGRTYPISELDASTEISKAAAEAPKIKEVDIKSTTAFGGFYLPNNTENKVHHVVPFYTLEFDITGQNGKVVYPKGFTYNVAEYVQLPSRIVAFSEDHADFIKSKLHDDDILVITAGDAISLTEKLGVPVFYMDELLSKRMYIQGIPTIVEQVGARYKITELTSDEE